MTYCNTMPKSKVAVSLETGIVQRVDRAVRAGVFPNRSRAIEAAVEEKLARLDRSRLARECAKLDRAFERAMAEEGAGELAEWPAY